MLSHRRGVAGRPGVTAEGLRGWQDGDREATAALGGMEGAGGLDRGQSGRAG